MRRFKWLMIISLILMMATVNAYANIDVSMQSDVAQPVVGTQFTVTAYCQGPETVAAMSLKFNFDSTMIQAVSVTDIKGGFTVPDATAIANANGGGNVLTFSFASISSPWTFTGNEAVASVTFVALNTPGNTTIDPTNTTIQDNTPPPGGPISVVGTLTGVTVTIKLGPDTIGPVVTPAPLPLSTNTILEGQAGVTVSGTITDGQSNVDSYQWARSTSNTTPPATGTDVDVNPNANPHNFTQDVNSASIPAGEYYFWVRGKDDSTDTPGGNWGPWQVSDKLTVNANQGPVTTNVTTTPASVVQGGTFQVDATITDPDTSHTDDVTAAEYYVGTTPPTDGSAPDFPAFAPGNSVNVSAPGVDSSSLSVGSHDVWVRGQDEHGMWGAWVKAATPLTVTACDVTAAFSYTPTSVETGQTVTFQNDSTETGAGPYTYDWDLNGDGTYEITGVGKVNQNSTYNTTGTVTVKLRAHGSAGCSTETSHDVVVNCNVQPDFSADKTEIIVEDTVNFTNDSTGSGAAAATYDWDFGDGNTTNGAAFTDVINNQYMTVGSFDVNLTAHGTGCDPVHGPLTIEVLPCDAQADFDAPLINTADSGLATVQFTDRSTFTGAATPNWVWDFGDGSPVDNTQNPSHDYAPGRYTVTLTVTGSTGCTTTKQMEIFVNDPACTVDASFDADKTTIEIGDTVTFTDTSAGTITSWYWNFGDGNTSTIQNPTNTYNQVGSFPVVLGAGDGSCTDYTNDATIVVKCDVIAAFTASSTVVVGTPVTFTNTSTGTGAATATWLWDFDSAANPGTDMSLEKNPTHTFNTVGTYTVRLTATSTVSGCITEATKVITVTSEGGNTGPGGVPTPPKPSAKFDVDPGSGNAPLKTNITDNSKIMAGYIVKWEFDFGDGTSKTFTEKPDPFTHEYSSKGTYTITLKVTADNDENDSAQQTVTVGDASGPPVASFTAEPQQGEEPLNVKFTDTSTGDINSWAWNFGDGASSSDQNPTHTYTAAGTYTVTLEVTGPGGSDTATKTIVVNPDDVVSADFSFTTDALMAAFTDLSSGNIVTWAWDFGDGGSSSDQNPTHTYTAAGTYSVTLTVTDDDGDQANATKDVTVSVPSVNAQFAATPTSANVNDVISFTDQSTGNIQSRLWSFGDGTTSTDVNPTHAYTASGTYTVSLTVTGFDGTSDTETKTDYITINGGGSGGVEPPTPVSPSDGATEAPLKAQLCVDEMTGVESVTFQVSFNGSNFDEESLIWSWTGDAFCATLPELLLNPGTTYCWRALVKYTDGTVSGWSDIFCFTTVETDPDDQDGSGVPDNDEVSDADKKQYFPDITFGELAKAVHACSGGAIFAVEGGENVSNIPFLAAYCGDDPLPSGCDSMPWGMIGFKIGVANPGDTAKIVIHFSEAISGEATMFIYDTIKGLVGYDNAVFSDDMKSVTVTLTDGSSVDRDGLKNGVIVISYDGFCVKVTPTPGGGGSGDTCFIGTVAGSGIGLGLTALAGIASAVLVRRRRRK